MRTHWCPVECRVLLVDVAANGEWWLKGSCRHWPGQSPPEWVCVVVGCVGITVQWEVVKQPWASGDSCHRRWPCCYAYIQPWHVITLHWAQWRANWQCKTRCKPYFMYWFVDVFEVEGDDAFTRCSTFHAQLAFPQALGSIAVQSPIPLLCFYSLCAVGHVRSQIAAIDCSFFSVGHLMVFH